MKFSQLAVGDRFKFVGWHVDRTYVKESNECYISGCGVYCCVPPVLNFFGGYGYICSFEVDVKSLNNCTDSECVEGKS